MATNFTVHLEELQSLCEEYTEGVKVEDYDKHFWRAFGPTERNPYVRMSGSLKCFLPHGNPRPWVSGSGVVEISYGRDAPIMIYTCTWTEGRATMNSIRTAEVFVIGKKVSIQGKTFPYTPVMNDVANPGCTTHVKVNLENGHFLFVTLVLGFCTFLSTPDDIGVETYVIAKENGNDVAADTVHTFGNGITLGSCTREFPAYNANTSEVLIGSFSTGKTGCTVSWSTRSAQGTVFISLKEVTEVSLNKFYEWLGKNRTSVDFIKGLGIKVPFLSLGEDKVKTPQPVPSSFKLPTVRIPSSSTAEPAPTATTVPVVGTSVTEAKEPFFATLRKDGYYDGPMRMIMSKDSTGSFRLSGMNTVATNGGVTLPTPEEVRRINHYYSDMVGISCLFD